MSENEAIQLISEMTTEEKLKLCELLLVLRQSRKLVELPLESESEAQ